MPTVNYTRDVAPFDRDMEQFGSTFTDAEIAVQLNGQTINPITIGTVRSHMGATEWWVQQQDAWIGSLQAFKEDPATPNPVVNFLEDIWSIVFALAGRSDVATTLVYNKRGKIAGKQGAELWAEFFNWSRGTATPLEEDDITDFYSDGGGLKYPTQDVSAADVAASRTEYNDGEELSGNKSLLDEEYRRLYNVHIAPIQSSSESSGVTDQAYKDALVAMSAGWVDQL